MQSIPVLELILSLGILRCKRGRKKYLPISPEVDLTHSVGVREGVTSPCHLVYKLKLLLIEL